MKPYKYCPHCAQPLQQVEIGGLKRWACSAAGCTFVHWDNPVTVVAAIVEHEGKIILARNRAWPDKFFALITGFLEKNEAPDVATIREVDEELGLTAHTPTLVGIYTFERMNQLIIAYHVLAEGQVKLGEELIDYKHIEPAKLRPWPAATGLALRDWMKSRGHTPPFSVDTIMKFVPLGRGGSIGTSGQPTAEQFEGIAQSGYEGVVNLALATSTGAIPEEAAIVARHGMRYHHIPVVFEAPTRADLDAFFAVMDEYRDRRVFVHCAMNMRVSAFMFLYRVLRLAESPDTARRDLAKVWKPEGVWEKFIEDALAQR